jgi:hypothetical protein
MERVPDCCASEEFDDVGFLEKVRQILTAGAHRAAVPDLGSRTRHRR